MFQITYRHAISGATLTGFVRFVHPQTGELLVERDDNGRREYVSTARVLKETPAP